MTRCALVDFDELDAVELPEGLDLGLDDFDGPGAGVGIVFMRFTVVCAKKSVSSQLRLALPGESGRGGCAASWRRASTLIETLSDTHSHILAVRPRSIQLSRAKLVDSAQFNPRLKPA